MDAEEFTEKADNVTLTTVLNVVNFWRRFGYGPEYHTQRVHPTVLSTSLGKTFFAWRFIFNANIFVLVDHILLETICLLCFCVLFSNIYTKIKVTAKSWSDLCNFYSKVIFWNFV